MVINKRLFLAAFMFMGAAVLARAEPPVYAADKACVAWKTSKRLFLVKRLDPVGVNCAVTVEAVTEKDSRRLRVRVPIAAFDSGDLKRDSHVAQILGAETRPELVFLSRPLAAKDWAALREGKTPELEGVLAVRGADYPVTLSVAVAGGTVSGSARTSYRAFKLEPPSVAGGIVAKVAEELELLYHLPLALVPR